MKNLFLLFRRLGQRLRNRTFTGTEDFNPGAGTLNLASAGPEDIFIGKLDPAGNLVWGILKLVKE